MKVYKIRNRETGLYSTGSMRPKWSKLGKVWNSVGTMRSHLRQWVDGGIGDYIDFYANAEIVEVEIQESAVHLEDAVNWINKKFDEEIAEAEQQILALPNDRYYRERLLRLKGAKLAANGG